MKISLILFISLFLSPTLAYCLGWYDIRHCHSLRNSAMIQSFIHEEGNDYKPRHYLTLRGPNDGEILIENRQFREDHRETEDHTFSVKFSDVKYSYHYNGASANRSYGKAESVFTSQVTIEFSGDEDFSSQERALALPIKGKSFEVEMECHFDSQRV